MSIIDVPDHLATIREEIEWQINNSLEDIERNNEIVRRFNLLKSKIVEGVEPGRQVSKKRRLELGYLEQLSRQCEELQQECRKMWLRTRSDDEDSHLQEYRNKICHHLQEQLNITFTLRDQDKTRKELADAMFYYLMRGSQQSTILQRLFLRLWDPLYDHTDSWHTSNWYELCCVYLFDKTTFPQLFKRLDNNKTALIYLLYKQPQLLIHKNLEYLMDRLIEHLPYDILHQILTNVRDNTGRTHMFSVDNWNSHYVKVYINHMDDLFELLSIRDTIGQTALHVNTEWVTFLLFNVYTPKHRYAFFRLVSITDNNDKTALMVSNHDALRSLTRQVESNKYVTSSTNILMIYNTNNRLGAEEEIRTIYNACESTYNTNSITLRRNRSEVETIDFITQAANRVDIAGQPLRSLIVILASHGSLGCIEDYHGYPIKLSDIEAAMCSAILDGCPKLLIVQSCQNTTVNNDSAIAYAPTHDDFCAVQSCLRGQKSTRGVFLAKLAEQIERSKNDINIFKLVNNITKEMEREGHRQNPIIMSTLKAGFFPIEDAMEMFNETDDISDRSRATAAKIRTEDEQKELGAVIFSYLMRKEESHPHVLNKISRLQHPFFNRTKRKSLYELFCDALGSEHAFKEFYSNLDNDNTLLQYYLLNKQPQLVLNKSAGHLMDNLTKHLPYDNLHKIIISISDSSRQSLMFYIELYRPLVRLYMNHIDDLFEVLEIRNSQGQTALHVNTKWITFLLADIYIPKLKDPFLCLTSLQDCNDETPEEVANYSDRARLALFRQLVENNVYIIRCSSDTKVIIGYNTRCGKNECPEAEEEANTLYTTVKSVYDEDNISIEKNKTKDELIKLVKRAASATSSDGVPFKALIVVLVSHGRLGIILDYADEEIRLTEIEDAMRYPIVPGRPQMLIAQCCQTGEQSAINLPYVPTSKHFCAVLACLSGQQSVRKEFLIKVSEAVRSNSKTQDIFQMIEGINREMVKERRKQLGSRPQNPLIMSSLIANYFPFRDWDFVS